MPLYTYKCDKGHVVELRRKIDERNMPVECTECIPDLRTETAFARPLMLRVPDLVSPNFPGADRWR